MHGFKRRCAALCGWQPRQRPHGTGTIVDASGLAPDQPFNLAATSFSSPDAVPNAHGILRRPAASELGQVMHVMNIQSGAQKEVLIHIPTSGNAEVLLKIVY